MPPETLEEQDLCKSSPKVCWRFDEKKRAKIRQGKYRPVSVD
jgi:hypothetical protein